MSEGFTAETLRASVCLFLGANESDCLAHGGERWPNQHPDDDTRIVSDGDDVVPNFGEPITADELEASSHLLLRVRLEDNVARIFPNDGRLVLAHEVLRVKRIAWWRCVYIAQLTEKCNRIWAHDGGIVALGRPDYSTAGICAANRGGDGRSPLRAIRAVRTT